MEYRRFGVMLDCSRNGVMKPEQVKKFVDILVKLGYNCLELYTEDVYEVEGEPYFGYLRGRYTIAELQELDAYAKSKGVELIPCMQTLAHFTAPRKNVPLNYLWDTADILLCEEEKTYEFLERCFQSLSKAFSSRVINIGMDEAHSLGLGKYLDKHGYTSRFDILTKHLSRVAQIAKKYGFTPHMWSDMFFRPINNGRYYGKNLHIPKTVYEKIPDGVELAYWDYYTQDKETYNDMLCAHEETGKNVWFVGGAWGWCGFAPYNRYSLSSMKPAMEEVRAHGVENVLIAMWGDHGKECSFYALLPALYSIRQYADGNFDDESIKLGFEKLFGFSYDDFCTLDLPNDTGSPNWNGTGWPENPCKAVLYQDPFQGVYDNDLENGTRVFQYAKHARTLYGVSLKIKEYDYIFKTLSDLCYVLELKWNLGIRTRSLYRKGDREALALLVKDYALLLSRLNVFYKSFYTLWHKENKPFGWEIQDARLGALERRLKTCKETLEKYLLGELDKIEELEEDILPTGKVDILENNYDWSLSRSNLI